MRGHIARVLPSLDGSGSRGDVLTPSWVWRMFHSCSPEKWLLAGLFPSRLGPPTSWGPALSTLGSPRAAGLSASPGSWAFLAGFWEVGAVLRQLP